MRLGRYIIDVDEVNSATQNFAASVFYEARWVIPLLADGGPGPLHRRLTEVWSPRLAIVDQQQAWPAFPAAVEVYRNGEVVFRQKVWGRFYGGQSTVVRTPLSQERVLPGECSSP